MELQPGEASLHAWKTVHSSGPNMSGQERVGLAIRYMTDEVRNSKAVVRERATLVSGSGGNFWDLERPPSEDGGVEELEQHRESMERERRNYFSGPGGQQGETTHYK